jgi:hypothetical protein
MHELEPKRIKRLLDRLLLTRARRDREERFSDAWTAADTELHEIERAIFRPPLGGATLSRPAEQRAPAPGRHAADARRQDDAGRRETGPARVPGYGSRMAG